LKRPVSNAGVVVALALGIGMNAAVFTFVNGILLRPPQGVRQTRKMIELWQKQPKKTGPQAYLPFNYPDYAYYRDHEHSLEGLLAFDGDGVDVIWSYESAAVLRSLASSRPKTLKEVSHEHHRQLRCGASFPLQEAPD